MPSLLNWTSIMRKIRVLSPSSIDDNVILGDGHLHIASSSSTDLVCSWSPCMANYHSSYNFNFKAICLHVAVFIQVSNPLHCTVGLSTPTRASSHRKRVGATFIYLCIFFHSRFLVVQENAFKWHFIHEKY